MTTINLDAANLSSDDLAQEMTEAQARMDALKAEQVRRAKMPPELRLAADLHRVKCNNHRGLGGSCDYDQTNTGAEIRDRYYDLADLMLSITDEKTALEITKLAVRPII